MRVAINARVLAKPEPAGVSRYTKQLLIALSNRDDDGIEYLVFGVDSLPEPVRSAPRVETAGVTPAVPSGPRVQFWEQVTLPRKLRRYDVDLLHSTAGFSPLLTDVPTILTVHDISPITHPEWFSRGYATLYRALTPFALRSADHVVTISAFSQSEIERTYPWTKGKISAVHNGLTPIPDDDTDPVDGLDADSYLLFVGSLNPRKNVSRLLDAYEQYRQQVDDPLPLVLAGSQRDVFAAVDRSPIDDVHALGFVPDAQRNWLYHHAAALLFPSLYEGFGLPIIEAMDCGIPVLTSNIGAMAEVAGDAAILVDPTDTDAIAAGIERIATDESLRSTLVDAGRERVEHFTWASTAAEMASVYRRAANVD
jgi:glycosyltransferase involved in cell wall biosynthesis